MPQLHVVAVDELHCLFLSRVVVLAAEIDRFDEISVGADKIGPVVRHATLALPGGIAKNSLSPMTAATGTNAQTLCHVRHSVCPIPNIVRTLKPCLTGRPAKKA
jgi:hypothetical protein